MNKNDLISKLANCIYVNGYSYPAHLAASNCDMAQWLKKSPAAIYQAIYGCATTANCALMQELLEQCPNKEAGTSMMVRGLARGGHFDELYDIKDYKTYTADIIFGHAQAGNQRVVASLLQKAHWENLLFESAVQGYASAGHAVMLRDLVVGTRFYGEGIYQAAKAGHVDVVNQLLDKCGLNGEKCFKSPLSQDDIRHYGFINKALSGYCQGGHWEQAAHLLARGADIQTALDGLKVNGMPCLEAYVGLFIVVSDAQSKAVLEDIKNELSLTGVELSPASVDVFQQLRAAYQRNPKPSLFEFLSELPSKEQADVFKQFDSYFAIGQADECFPGSDPG